MNALQRRSKKPAWTSMLTPSHSALAVWFALAAPKWIISVSMLRCVCWVKAEGTTSSSTRGPPGSSFPLPSCPFNQTTMSNHNSLGTWHIQLSIDFYGVVINFLSITGPGHNIRRLEAACSPAINHDGGEKKTRQRRAVALVSSWIIHGSYDPSSRVHSDRRVLRKHESHLYVADCFSVWASWLLPQTAQLHWWQMHPRNTADLPRRWALIRGWCPAWN